MFIILLNYIKPMVAAAAVIPAHTFKHKNLPVMEGFLIGQITGLLIIKPFCPEKYAFLVKIYSFLGCNLMIE